MAVCGEGAHSLTHSLVYRVLLAAQSLLMQLSGQSVLMQLSGQSDLMQSFNVTAIRGRHLSSTLLNWCLNKDRLLLGQ